MYHEENKHHHMYLQKIINIKEIILIIFIFYIQVLILNEYLDLKLINGFSFCL